MTPGLTGVLVSIIYTLTVNHMVWYTVEPLNKDTFGTSHFVLCREVVLLACFTLHAKEATSTRFKF